MLIRPRITRNSPSRLATMALIVSSAISSPGEEDSVQTLPAPVLELPALPGQMARHSRTAIVQDQQERLPQMAMVGFPTEGTRQDDSSQLEVAALADFLVPGELAHYVSSRKRWEARFPGCCQ